MRRRSAGNGRLGGMRTPPSRWMTSPFAWRASISKLRGRGGRTP
jgi:hypothetical protein